MSSAVQKIQGSTFWDDTPSLKKTRLYFSRFDISHLKKPLNFENSWNWFSGTGGKRKDLDGNPPVSSQVKSYCVAANDFHTIDIWKWPIYIYFDDFTYHPLVMTNSSLLNMTIEIVDFPSYTWWIFPVRKLLVYQRVPLFLWS